MDLVIRDDAGDGIERRHHAQLPVIPEAEIAVFGIDITPRDAKHRMALFDQLADQRVMRQKIEYVVFHDPRRHDQHRFGEYLAGGEAVLDQFDQVIAKDDFALASRRD